MEKLNLYSGDSSLKFLARDMKYNKPSVSQLYKFEETLEYQKNKLILGVTEFDEIYSLNMRNSNAILVYGPRGSGKSWNMQSLWNRFYAAGGDVAILADLKPEYYTCTRPLQKKFHKFFLQSMVPTYSQYPEKAKTFPIKTYRPHFMSRLTGAEAADSSFIKSQFSLDDINFFDFLSLLGVESEAQKESLESVFSKVENNTLTNISEIIAEIKKSNIAGSSRSPIIRRLKNIEEKGVIGDMFPNIDFVGDLQDGSIPCMDLSGFENLGQYHGYASAYIGVILRKLLSMKKQGKLARDRHIALILDEVNRYCPNTGNSTAKEEVLKFLDLSRRERISMIFSTQDYKRVPDTIIEQCNIIMIPHGLVLSSVKEIIREKASYEYDNVHSFGTDIAQQYGRMKVHKDGTRDWLVIDTGRGGGEPDNFIIRPLPPLGAKQLEGE